MKSLLKTTGVLLGLLAATSAHAVTMDLSFYQLTSNAASPIAGQLALQLVTSGTGFTLKFSNNGPVASNISEIYASDGYTFGTLASPIADSGAGVNFVAGGTPASLPGSSNALDILASATSPAPSNGVSPGEWVMLSYTYGGTLNSEAALTSALTAGLLQFGVHVTGIATTGNSNSFVTGGTVGEFPPPTTPGVPDGGVTVVLLGASLAALGFVKRRLA